MLSKPGLHLGLILGLLSHAAFAGSAGPEASKLQVATLNIKWYGLGGSMSGDFDDEYRNAALKQYLRVALDDADVIAFQEIVDVESFQDDVIGKSRDCVSYAHDDERHQHVVICYKDKYIFDKVPRERDYIIQDVARGKARYRPAVYGILKEKSGTPLAHVIAVHLKAFPKMTAERLAQVEVLAKRIKELDQDVPVVLLGDFNTFEAPANGRRTDDAVLMQEVFQKARVAIKRVTNPAHKTYMTQNSSAEFDQLWISSSISAKAMELGGPCQKRKNQGDFNDVDYYNENVSDHCSVSLEMTLPVPR